MFQKKMLPFLIVILIVITSMSLPTISFAQSDKEKLELLKELFSTPDNLKKERLVDYTKHELGKEEIQSCIDYYKTCMKKHGIKDSVSGRLFKFRMFSKHSQITHEEDFFGDSLFTWMGKMMSYSNKETTVKIKIVFGAYSKTFLEKLINTRSTINTSESKQIMEKNGRTTAILVAYKYKSKPKSGFYKSEEDPLEGFLGGYDLGEIHPPY